MHLPLALTQPAVGIRSVLTYALSQPRVARALAALAVLLGTATATVAASPSGTQVDFNRDIKPILSNRCWACHGPDPETREAGLRLDTFAGATEDLGGYAAVVPGDAEASELIRRIGSDDEYEVMPPPSHGEALTQGEVQTFRAWVEAGGDYAQHWSYVPPQRPDVPPLPAGYFADAAPQPIDHFIARRLADADLPSSPPADRYTLIRRLSLDLTGLPPTPAEADAFVHDPAPDAYERLVERLLADPAAAERWAAVWLDLARYADSAGYADDPPRTIWAYRDYVIESLAENKSVDQFTIEQIAGDLLDNPTLDQQIASGFHRNTMTNSEGGTDDEEFRSAAIVDRVNTTLSVWMGTTIACAQCHTHKYDPITQEEYFRLYAIFNNTADADRRDEAPTMPVFSDQQRRERDRLQAAIDAIDAALQETSPQRTADQQAWEAKTLASLQQVPPARFVRIEIPDQQRLLSLAEVEVIHQGRNVAPDGKATQSSTDYNGPAERAIDGTTDGDYEQSKSVTHTAQENSPWWEVDLGEPVAIEQVVVWNRTDNQLQSRLNGFRVTLFDADRKPLFQRTFAEAPPREQRITITPVPAEIASILQVAAEQRPPDQAQQLTRYYLEQKRAPLAQQLAAIQPRTTVPVMQELQEDRRETFIQIRGNFRNLDRKVTPGVPEVFHDLPDPAAPDPAAPDRLDLAKWLVDRQNPLTARVLVNRWWEKIFGTGLVETSEEFGSQGELPSHPELLDWLACELLNSGWDRNHVLRQIVTSATYRQSSKSSPQRLKADPFNRLLSRGPRFRLPAEMIRDQALASSGLLSREMFGPSVQPPRPSLNLRAAFGGSTDWKNSRGGDRYRRGLYTEWRRSMPYPSMSTFDAPSREICTLDRGRTNTPLQALVTLNDPVYVEAAQALAREVFRHHPQADDSQRLAWAFRRCLIRPATAAELETLVALLERTRQRYRHDPEQATQMATDPLGPIPEDWSVSAGELAAWTVVGNVLLNLDETFQPR